MAFKHGKDSVFKIQNAAGSLTDISAYVDTVSLGREADTAETTTFGKTSKTYIGGLLDGSLSFGGPWDLTIDTLVSGILGMERTWEHYPEGTGTGARKFSGSCIVTKFDPDSDVGDAVKWSADAQVTGDVTVATVP